MAGLTLISTYTHISHESKTKHKNTKPPPNPQQKQQQTIIKAAGHNEQVTLQSDPNPFFFFLRICLHIWPLIIFLLTTSLLLLPVFFCQ